MPIDPRISLGAQPIQIADPLAQYGQMQNILAAQAQQQAAGTQQQAAQMQMTQAQRQFDQDEKYVTQMAEVIGKEGGPTDMMKAARIMSTNRNPQVSQAGIQMLQSLQRLDEAKKAGIFGAPQTAIPSVGPAPGALGSGTFDMNPPSVPFYSQPNIAGQQISLAQSMPVRPQTAIAPIDAANKLAPAPAAPVNQLTDNTKTLQAEYMKLAQYSDLPGVKDRMDLIKAQLQEANKLYPVGGSLVTGTGRSVFTAPEKPAAPPSMVAEYTFAKTPDGGNFKGSFQDFVTARAAAGRAPPQPVQPSAPVAVVGADGKVKYVSREEAISKGMTPANAMEGLAPKEIQAREAKFPAAKSAVETFESSAEKLAKDLETLATHKGLSGISGLIYGRTPAVTKEARAAQALYDSIVARGGFQELQNMRASSPTGGALGNVSNQEGQYLRDAFAPINRTQDTADLSRSLTEAANATRVSKQRVREAYDLTYDYKNQGGGGKVVDFGSLK
jgi:hypothetical protein